MFETSATLASDGCAADADDLEPPWWVELAPAEEPWSDADVLLESMDRPVGAGLLASLMQVDASALTADEAVTFAQQVDRFAAFAAGFQAVARAQVTRRLLAESEASRFVTPEMLASAELSAALRLSQRSLDAQIQHAFDLTGPMSPLGDALLTGTVSAAHARAVARELDRLPLSGDAGRVDEFTDQCARILAVVVPFATTHTPGQSARRARALVLATDPVSARERRQREAERAHGVWLTPTGSGSCEVLAVMPLAHGLAVLDAVTTLAGDPLLETSEGCVTAGQRRVAALATLVLGDPGAIAVVDGPVMAAKVNARVDVLVPLSSIVGTNDQGGLIGDEPVTADVIRELLAEASPASTLRRLVTDAAGVIVDAGRTRYAVSDAQRHVVALRDGHCRFPGCARRAVACEVDHARAWDDGGGTDLQNLGALCKHHHQLKTHGGWLITASTRRGACTWRSPLGRIYEHRPPEVIPPDPSSVVQECPPPF
jgi:hypothetical protein